VVYLILHALRIGHQMVTHSTAASQPSTATITGGRYGPILLIYGTGLEMLKLFYLKFDIPICCCLGACLFGL
jgi:hypothetical protein